MFFLAFVVVIIRQEYRPFCSMAILDSFRIFYGVASGCWTNNRVIDIFSHFNNCLTFTVVNLPLGV